MSDKAEMLPGLAERSLVHRWAGIYPTIFCKGIPLKPEKTLSILMILQRYSSFYNMGRHFMKLSVRTVICVLASLVVLICFSSVYGHRVSADSTIVESGSLWNCDWELDADGNLYVICKADTLGLGYLISNVQNEVKTVTFDLSGVKDSYEITLNGSGADVSSISFADTEFMVDSLYLEDFTTVDEDHIFFLTENSFRMIGLKNMTVTGLSFLKDTEVFEVRIENCSDLNANNLGLSGSVKSIHWFGFPEKELIIPNNGCAYILQSNILEKVVIEDGRTSVNDYMFYSCYALTDVSVPDSVTVIGSYAFNYCVELKEIGIPDSVTVIGESAFSNTALESVSLPSGLKSIEKYAFRFTGITSLSLPEGLENLGYGAFCYTPLEYVYIPAGVGTVSASAFSDCENLKKVEIAKGITGIGADAFSDCKSLTEINLPEGINKISYDAFYGCSNLRKIDLPRSVRIIDAYSFAGSGIEYIDIPKGVKRIENNAFENCRNLKIVVLPVTIKAIVADAFLHCDSISAVYYGGTRSEFEAISIPAHTVTNPNYEVVSEYSVSSIYSIFSYPTLNFNRSTGGKWIRDNDEWRFLNLNGTYSVDKWQQINDNWYFFNESGHMVTGWQKLNGKWYYFNSDGEMQDGFKTIDGSRYFLGETGDGAMVTGWNHIWGMWYLFSPSGVMQTGWARDNGKWYYFNYRGWMQTGWIKVDGNWYYLNNIGVMQTGWKKIDGEWYYLNDSGVMQTGWKKIDGEWYYLNDSGKMQTGWKKIDGKWYYFYSSGAMAYDTTIDGYELDSGGVWIS